MHHKYVVIDNKFVAMGSFNWTKAAASKNNENCNIVRDSKLAITYS